VLPAIVGLLVKLIARPVTPEFASVDCASVILNAIALTGVFVVAAFVALTTRAEPVVRELAVTV